LKEDLPPVPRLRALKLGSNREALLESDVFESDENLALETMGLIMTSPWFSENFFTKILLP